MGAAAQAPGAVTRRQRYLDLATELASRPPRSGLPSFPHAVAHVRIADVARAVGVTRSAVYRHWSTQEDFWSDLAAYLAAGGESAWLRTLVRAGDAAGADSGVADTAVADTVVADRADEVCRRALNRIQDELLADHQVVVRAALVAYPDVGAALATVAASERRLVAHLAGLADRLRAARGCRFAGGLTATDAAVALGALGEGFALVARVAPRSLVRTPVPSGPAAGAGVTGAAEPPWLPLAFGARALLHAFTAPPPVQPSAPAAVAASRDDAPPLPGTAPRVPPAAPGAAPAVADTAPPAPPHEAPPAAVAVEPAVAGTVGAAGRAGAGGAGAAAADRRRDYLRAAARLARSRAPGPGDDDPVPVLGHVTLAGLARETGDDRRRLYELWPSQSEFRLDLLTHLLARTCRELGGVLEAGGAGPILPVADRLFAWLRGSDWLPAAFAFAPVAGRRAVHERARCAADAGREALAGSLDRLLAAAGRQMRPGITLDQLTFLLLALVAGAVRTLRTNPALWRTDVRSGDAEHTLFGLAFAALAEATTQPASP